MIVIRQTPSQANLRNPKRGGMSKASAILHALEPGPKTNRELCEVVDDIGPYVARMCAKLRARGLVVNIAEPRLGRPASYALARPALLSNNERAA